MLGLGSSGLFRPVGCGHGGYSFENIDIKANKSDLGIPLKCWILYLRCVCRHRRLPGEGSSVKRTWRPPQRSVLTEEWVSFLRTDSVAAEPQPG